MTNGIPVVEEEVGRKAGLMALPRQWEGRSGGGGGGEPGWSIDGFSGRAGEVWQQRVLSNYQFSDPFNYVYQ